jgi:hypothetical protein
LEHARWHFLRTLYPAWFQNHKTLTGHYHFEAIRSLTVA